MSDKVEIKLSDSSLEVPLILGSEGERAIDIATLRAKTGLVTIDPAFMNTASTKSAITFLDAPPLVKWAATCPSSILRQAWR